MQEHSLFVRSFHFRDTGSNPENTIYDLLLGKVKWYCFVTEIKKTKIKINEEAEVGSKFV